MSTFILIELKVGQQIEITVRFVVVFDWFLVIPSLLAGFCQICWISALFAVVKISNRKIKLTSTDKIQIIQLILALQQERIELIK